MTFLAWMAVVGALLLLMALSSAFLRRLPITTSAVYLVVGLAIGPAGLGLIELNFISSRELIGHLTEVAVIVSLFVGGLKLRLPLRHPAWAAAFMLAGPVMIASIVGVAILSHFAFGFDWGVSILLGAILAPTDPVLAGTVSVNDSADEDRMRYGLSGEAGFNDGAAFPFVIFGLMWLDYGTVGSWTAGWALHRLVWAVPAGLVLGYILGKGLGRVAILLRSRFHDTEAPNDFLALALIALAYTGAETVGAWGFLAAFTAGLGFRRSEKRITSEDAAVGDSGRTGEFEGGHPPAEDLVMQMREDRELTRPVKAAGVVISEIISFGDTAERLLEVLLVLLVGVCVGLYWDWRAVPLAIALFFLIRPLSVLLFLSRTKTHKTQRLMMGWFGIRGIGSLFYLSYAMTHGLIDNITDVVGITLSVVALSIVVHGISSQPILAYYERSILSRH